MTNHPGRRWAASVAAVVVVAGVAAALGSTQAGAVTVSGVRAPAPLGQSWYVYQGYNSGTHTGDSRYGLDLTTNSSTTSTAGRAVTAPVGGTISYWQTGFGNLCVNTAEGRSYTLTHIIAAKTSGTVVTGQKLGTVAAAGQKNNNGVAHLHFEMWSGRNCYKQSAPIPFDDAHHARICGAPNFTASGPNGGNGTWSRKTFKSVPCGAPAGPQSLMGRLKYVAKVDFNGDKKSDIFYQPAASGGNPWKVSRSGTSRWSTINTGDFDPSRALIGDFNGDGKSDVFYEATSSGSNPWKVSWSGTSKWATINSGDFDPSRALVGDFNGDGKSDIFYQASASGSNPWKVSWSGRSKWATINAGDFDPSRALVGDFNGDRKTDIFYESSSSGSNPWKVSWSGTSKWATINTGDFDPSRALVGDFNDDGKSDIFYQASASGSNPWKVSWSGRSKWATINVADFDPTRAW